MSGESVLEARIAEMKKLFVCSIMWEDLRDPVVAADGLTYERESATLWENTKVSLAKQLQLRRIAYDGSIPNHMDTNLLYPNTAVCKVVHAWQHVESCLKAEQAKRQRRERDLEAAKISLMQMVKQTKG
ncbi:hypothetical protein BC830DRAFT_1148944 [Chytriomyces sp. MP71]|nr:hypothetical protein BC830DRAFT_1148944 [Chytriomyces sp. MP71]